MGLPGRYVGRGIYYKPTREQDETSTFVFEGITQNLWQFICYKGYIFYVWHYILNQALLIISVVFLLLYCHWVRKSEINVAGLDNIATS